MKRWILLVIALIAVAGPRAVSAQQATAMVSMSDTAQALLHPGDVVRLRVWREPDLSGDFPVDESGLVTFPKIGGFNALDYTPLSLKKKLLEAYAVYLRNPSVEVTMLRRINILGAVQKPGLYPVDATMTIADALAVAGGASPNGDPHHIELIRSGVRITESLSAETSINQTPLRSGDQLFVPERSFIVRNAGLVATGISVTASMFIALFIRR
jgi:polysaccharide export outer membrane protein